MPDNSFSNQKPNLRPWTVGAAVLGVAVLAGGSTFALTNPAGADKAPASNAAPDLKVEHAPVDRGRTPAGSFAPIVQKVAPSVVEVSVTSKAEQQQFSGPDADMFRRFFGQGRGQGPDPEMPEGRGHAQHGLGSGVIVSTDGYILTNNHVVKDATDIRVALDDGRQFSARVIGTDPRTDVALLKIKADKLPAVTFADSTELAVGDVVLAVGNPFGIGQTVTQGIVSAKDRTSIGDGGQDEDYIQTDAAINPGNSGGALVDVEGRLVGINTAILSRSGGNQGIGFAVPSNLCQWVMTSLTKTGHVERGFMGMSIQNLTPALAADFKLDRINGALVADVVSGGAAESAGLKSGDVIRQFNGQPVKDASQLKLQVAETAPGTKVSLDVVRAGENKTLDATLRQAPGEKLAGNDRKRGTAGEREALAGVAVANLEGNTRAQVNAPDDLQGAVITEVAPDSAAAEAGLRAGDVITEINHQPIKNAQDAVKNTEKAEGEQTLVKIWSRGGIHYLTVDEAPVG